MTDMVVKKDTEYYKKKINPLVNKFIALCEKHSLPFHLAIQLDNDPEHQTEDIFSQAYFNGESSAMFQLLSSLTTGEFGIVDLGNGDFLLKSSNVNSSNFSKIEGKNLMVVPFNGIIL